MVALEPFGRMRRRKMIKFKCERCKAAIKAGDTIAGKNVECPTCRHKNVVPMPRAKARKDKDKDEHEPLPKVVYVAGALVVLVGVAWAVWPSGKSDTKETGELLTREERMRAFEEKMEKERQVEEAKFDETELRQRRGEEEYRKQREQEEGRHRKEKEQREKKMREEYETQAKLQRFREEQERLRREKKMRNKYVD